MTKQEAYQLGIERGRQAALDVDFEPGLDDSLEAAALEAEMNSRQYAGFEAIDRALSDDEDFDDLWTQYNDGIHVGVRRGARERRQQI